MALAAVGIVAGAAVTLSGASIAAGLLYGVSPRDPFTFAVVAAVLGALTLLACYVPARRVARTDPAITLRG
jgi:ABC-type antimicrobial peptide transport system permease subunit